MNDNTEKQDDEPFVGTDFIRTIINEDMESGKHQGRVATRFPPEPNGYLHIGHSKSICLNFGLAQEYGGTYNLRFDDTNPVKEDDEYVQSIQNDITWLGFNWEDRLYFASDYFDKLYEYATHLIKEGKAYVCGLNAEQVREYRGTFTEPGRNSPDRDRSVEENLDLFQRMKAGEFEDGKYTLRLKIDMSSPNINLRDPAIYRIRHATHHRTGDDWCIYPLYDYTHCISDALEMITHSICTLEFEDHRPLYDWVLENTPVPSHPQQIEFAKLNFTYTVLSKRRLLRLVEEGYVDGWDDPRMPTLAGMRRRGYTPAAIREMCDKVGVAKANSTVDIAFLEFCVREDLNKHAQRRMAVLDPIKLVITNYPEGQVEELEADNNPEDDTSGKRMVPFSRELYIEREDFMEDAPKKYFRLTPGKEVRLKHAYYVTCTDFVKDADGNVTEVHCTYDPDTMGGWSDDGRKVKGTIHWVSVEHAKDATVRLYERFYTKENPYEADEEGQEDYDFTHAINPNSLTTITAKIEPELASAKVGVSFQFLRKGYFCVDSKDSTEDQIVFNQTVGLRDSWAKIKKKN